MGKDATLVYQQIVACVTDKAFLRRALMTKKALLGILQEVGFRQSLSALLAKDRFTAVDALSACAAVLRRISKEPDEGWLSYIYQFLVEGIYPDGRPDSGAELWRGCFFFIGAYHELLLFMERNRGFDPKTNFSFATQIECEESGNKEQYQRFFDLLHTRNILELMHIGRSVRPFDMLGHVAGVHHIAMHMARQLSRLGLAVDIPLVSASAALHDIGKYGCKGEEERRIPYLHYYYTEVLLKRYDMEAVAHVAANHSTWDLEIENLPVESLLLIYADFRVKSQWNGAGKEEILFYTLKDSYGVILSKLDNVDEAKKRRYERVYAKLSDFEAYMISLGANPDPYSLEPLAVDNRDAALLTADDAVRALKFRAISHNLRLMRRLSSDTSFADILEDARGEKDWKNIRTYLNIIEEYFTYMTQKQKQLTMRFLYELFMQAQGDIRSQAGMLYGRILAGFDVVYRKELPKAYSLAKPSVTSLSLWEEGLELMLTPDFKLAQRFKTWISYALKVVLRSLLNSVKAGDSGKYLRPYLACFAKDRYGDELTSSVLLDSIVETPRAFYREEALAGPFRVARRLIVSPEPKHQAYSLRFLHWVLESEPGGDMLRLIREVINMLTNERDVGVEYLLMQVYERLPGAGDKAAACAARLLEKGMGELYLIDLKTATPWVMKEVNIRFLLYRVERDRRADAFQVATHLVNLIRVSERYAVRHRAGEALERIAPTLTREQRNEIAVELTRGMESATDEFSKYIPRYLGRFVLNLHPKELDEVLDEFEKYMKSASERSACIVLPTLGVLLECYSDGYRRAFGEQEREFTLRKRRMISMLLGGLAHYNETVAREAFLVIGKQVFGENIPYKNKDEVFGIMYRKLLLLLDEQSHSTLTFFNHAASLNHIYRFIIDSAIRLGPRKFDVLPRVAFFPGTFDPFSSSHKAIVREVKRQGFEVYLALDEFSWSKHTQPHMIRRRLVNMSVADLFDVYLFPDDIPVNLANPDDLGRLKSLYPGREVYVAVGSDVVKNASAYKKPAGECSIHTFGHIVFLRSIENEADEKEKKSRFSCIQGDVLTLAHDSYFEEVSSTRIRENIDHNREISMLVDPVAQSFIYDNGLYLREPQYKELLRPEAMSFHSYKPSSTQIRERYVAMAIAAKQSAGDACDTAKLTARLNEAFAQPKARLLALFNEKDPVPLGIACYYSTSAEYLFNECHSVRLAEYMRRHTSGRIAVISGLYAHMGEMRYDVMRLLITEALSECLKQDYTYAIHVGWAGFGDDMFYDLLERRGFMKLPEADNDAPVYAVDMRAPIALIEDVQERIKAPLRNDPKVVEVLRRAHRDFTVAMTKLYPGRLVLSFHAGVMNHALVRKILRANGVEHIPPDARQLGDCMCVPYGKTLRGIAVPNTVTKTLHVDKAYMPDMKSFAITKYPGYSTLMNQIRTIKSFNRPIFLVDDLLHKGYRLEALDPLFKEVGLDVRKIIVGILSGRGKDLMSVQERGVDSVYFIPNLRYWFVDSMLYPFLGGDSVQRPDARDSNYLLPSVNQIFPYTSPVFISGASKNALFNLSLTCLNNAREILTTLEGRHQELFGYNLTLNRLGQAMQTARVPDKGGCMKYDLNLAPSIYVENDIEMLLRLECLLHDQAGRGKS